MDGLFLWLFSLPQLISFPHGTCSTCSVVIIIGGTLRGSTQPFLIFKVRKEKRWTSSNDLVRVELFLNLLDVTGAELKKKEKEKRNLILHLVNCEGQS